MSEARTDSAQRTASHVIVTSDVSLDGTVGFEAYRDATAETTEVRPVGDVASFHVRGRAHHLGSVVLADVQSSSVEYTRTARHVARAAYDHYQIVVNLGADIRYQSGRLSAIVRPGEAMILDSARETNAVIQAPEGRSTLVPALFVPRAAVKPWLVASGDEHFKVLARGEPQAKLLSDHVAHMLRMIDSDPATPIGSAVHVLHGLLAGIFGGKDSSPVAREAMRRAALDSLKRLIDRHLGSPELSADLICARSGWSRATVYRLFEPEGGLASHIRQRRLQWAFRELMSGSATRRRILDLAVDCQFASEPSFNRAFRRLFGISPGEVRYLAARSRVEMLRAASAHTSDRAVAIRWIRRLGADPTEPRLGF